MKEGRKERKEKKKGKRETEIERGKDREIEKSTSLKTKLGYQ